MRRRILTVAIGCVAPVVLAAPAETEPGRTRLDYRTAPVALEIALPFVDAAALADGDVREPGVPHRIGFPRRVPEASRGDLLVDASWTLLADGAQVTSFTVRGPGAGRLRVALRAALPEGALVRFFRLDRGPERSIYPVYTREDFARGGADVLDSRSGDGGGLRWSPIVDGDTLGIEIELPAGADADGVGMRILRISHMPAAPAQGADVHRAFDATDDESCPLVDVACKVLPACPRSAVGWINFTESDGTTYMCTGTVIDSDRPDAEDSREPRFLTARHCISAQAVADTMEIDFHYEVETCGGVDLSADRTTLYGGGELLVADPSTDMTLLELRSRLPDGVCLAGWDADAAGAQTADSQVMSITHPAGEPKKYAAGHPINGPYRVEVVSDFVVDSLVVDWTEGDTLGGSSGGGLFALRDDGSRPLIGTLSGAPVGSCSIGNTYGRFDLFFANQAWSHLRPGEPLADDHGGNLVLATGILLNSEIAARIDHGADADVFRVVVREPGILVMNSTGEIDTVGRLLRDDGTTIEWDDDDGYQGNFNVSVHVETGVYFVRVTGYEPGAVGSYRLHVAFTPDDDRPAAEIPLLLSASHEMRMGLIRLFNASSDDGTVEITAFDDDGVRHGPVTLAIAAREIRHFDSADLENGNPANGMTGGTGSGLGDWRLRFDTDLDIEVAAYSRTSDGFLTVMHDTVPRTDGLHVVPIFNPGSELEAASRLRLTNPDTARAVRVRITGRDDAGVRADGAVKLTLPPGGSYTLDAAQLEAGSAATTGSLGDGEGRWRLKVEAEGEIVVVNLLAGPSGHLANLSSPGPVAE